MSSANVLIPGGTAAGRVGTIEFPSRLYRSIDEILSLLAEHGPYATFFVLGWVARRGPSVVRRIHAPGHEIASHGLAHQPIVTDARSAFRCDVRGSKAVLEDLIGQPVIGYRAPSYSINRDTEWALDTLAELGFEYDSSI